MSYVVASLLMVMSEEQAFWILVALLESPKHLKDCIQHIAHVLRILNISL